MPTHVPTRLARHTAARAASGARHPRLAGIDAARGLALVGMIVVNVGPVGSESLLQRLYLLPYGRASVLFVVVAGIGMGYLLSRRPERERWSTVTWRAALLFGGGVALQELTDQVNVILPTYAVLFLLAPLLWRLPDRALLGVGVVLALAGPAVIVAHETIWPSPQPFDPVTLGTPPWEAAYSLLLTGRYPLLSWTVPFVAGLCIARLDVTDTAVLRRLAGGGAAVAAGAVAIAQLTYLLIGPDADRGPWRLLTGAAHGQMPLWLASSIGGAVAIVAACVLVLRRFERPRVLGWLVACGRLSLTLYVLHFVVLALIKPAQGFSLGQGVLISSALVVAVIVAAALWARTGRQGPIEQLLRRSWLLPRTTRVRTPTHTGPTPERARQQ
ncbi:acyltransferase family protein [Promicromonospora sp. NPDC023805]|uniref:acyltransferase family protein n=1 Tax=Promicromonospora sp. NPDC023805 TaxID=3154696 RepID=UPI0033CE3A9C